MSASDSLSALLLIVDHHEGPAVEKSRRFPQLIEVRLFTVLL
jgi:predicted deacetylase